MSLICLILSVVLTIIPSGKTFVEPLQKRDSILVADQVKYGLRMDAVQPGTVLAFPDLSELSNDTLTLVRNWQIDTIGKKKIKPGKPVNIEASIVLAPFEAAEYKLPPLYVQRTFADRTDTLEFEPSDMKVTVMPIDTATFVIHDLKAQRTYPVTFSEVAPYVGGGLVLAALVALAIYLIRRRMARKLGENEHKDPAYIIALRKLDAYRGDKYWAPEKQKAFYSGITDALKEYIVDRFGVDCLEMTTAELFSALKKEQDLTPEMYSDLKDLFERADFVKFAKHTATDTENASALPLAVNFVTSTYQSELQAEETEKKEVEA